MYKIKYTLLKEVACNSRNMHTNEHVYYPLPQQRRVSSHTKFLNCSQIPNLCVKCDTQNGNKDVPVRNDALTHKTTSAEARCSITISSQKYTFFELMRQTEYSSKRPLPTSV